MKNLGIGKDESFVWMPCPPCKTHRNMLVVHPNPKDTSTYRLQCPVCSYMIRKVYTTYIQAELFGIGESDSERIEREIREHPDQYPDLIMA
jgi:hypothetical protein